MLTSSEESHNHRMLESSAQRRGDDDRDAGEKADDVKMRLIESLRGRLLAERVATKTAKEEADHLAIRLEELERNLAEEIKCRKKAEKRLEFALEKLETLNIMDHKNQMRSEEGAKPGSVMENSVEEVNEMTEVSISYKDDRIEEEEEEEEEENNDLASEELPVDDLRKSCDEKKQETEVGSDEKEESMLPIIIEGCKRLRSEVCKPQNKGNAHHVLFSLKNVKKLLLYSMGKKGG